MFATTGILAFVASGLATASVALNPPPLQEGAPGGEGQVGSDAFEAITGLHFYEGASGMMIVPGVGGGPAQLYAFIPNALSPKIRGEFGPVGVVEAMQTFAVSDPLLLATSAILTADDGRQFGVALEGTVQTIALSIVTPDGEHFSMSGLVADTTVSLSEVVLSNAGNNSASSSPLVCSGNLMLYPGTLAASFGAAAADAEAGAQIGAPMTNAIMPNALVPIPADCFGEATNPAQCLACEDSCAQDAVFARRACRADCTDFDLTNIGIGGGLGVGIGVCGGGFGAVLGGLIGSLSGAIAGREICESRCMRKFVVDLGVCEDKRRRCIQRVNQPVP
ncbi:MAG: hypothetical protein HYX51_01055 [Chloroflexi bacterium]|nr:hypothetical protein [Chloroflexota bacterium]